MIEVGFGFRMVPGPVRSSNATRHTRSRWHWLRKRGNVTFVRPAAEIDDRKERFYLAIASVLRWARLFGVFPLSNITATDPSAFRFHYFSPYIVLSALSIVGGLFIMAAALVRLNRVGINAMNIAEPIFFGMCTLLQLLFVRLAQAWRGFMVYWAEREEMFFARPYGAINLRRKVIGLAVCILTSALVEHVVYVINQAYNVYQESLTCQYNVTNPLKLYGTLTFGSVYQSVPYHHLLTMYLLYTTISLTFIWTFTDLFIMLVATGIACRFGQLNKRIDSNLQNGSEAFWGEMRTHFVGLIELVERTNRIVGPLLIASCANDMYFLCLQTLNALEDKPYDINDWYFRYSFTFLILRTSVKLWFAADVDENSVRTHKLVQKIRSEHYNDELEILRICSSGGVSISGMGFFTITRRIFLTMAGSILTYELVLMRFHRSSKGVGEDLPCGYID
ncbi:AGAP012713-PA [Anopheles gambiae str. PEST]|uniref:Gustatory receptor n=1 Tax=Anopheles gambiae TaxID=7165 RepID=Q7PU09_ANOGA|nr:AGAP012713-PA [Anopheles gambiae str. PEST]